ncbi:putative F-box domain-containing protein [Medicago truncatula]|uniref:F-box protein n=1 Tax=Medicago truncatula TaxID=3880 RepID=A0A072UXA9_MEDTR|nr:F-box protein At3g44326 [Medicago truncatula]KEH34429.1 F-box protein [Medicago truncatula]RHN67831.1 putative F-box domain-containing protein [Medicago truncatula]
MRMNIFSRLDTDIIHTHILPRLDGTTLTVLSSVCSELRHMICHSNEDLWRNICTSTWPSLLLDPIVHNVISTFPGGYRSFFSDAFPSLHNHKNNNSYRFYPPTTELIHVVDVFVHGKPLFSRVLVEHLNTNNFPYFSRNIFDVKFDYSNLDHIHFLVNEEYNEYLQENLRLSWVVIDPTRKRAAKLFCSSVEPLSVIPWLNHYEVVYAMVMAGESQVRTKMINCVVRVFCFFNEDELHLRRVLSRMEDVDGCLVGVEQGVTILLNAIHYGERKKFETSYFDMID